MVLSKNNKKKIKKANNLIQMTERIKVEKKDFLSEDCWELSHLEESKINRKEVICMNITLSLLMITRLLLWSIKVLSVEQRRISDSIFIILGIIFSITFMLLQIPMKPFIQRNMRKVSFVYNSLMCALVIELSSNSNTKSDSLETIISGMIMVFLIRSSLDLKMCWQTNIIITSLIYLLFIIRIAVPNSEDIELHPALIIYPYLILLFQIYKEKSSAAKNKANYSKFLKLSRSTEFYNKILNNVGQNELIVVSQNINAILFKNFNKSSIINHNDEAELLEKLVSLNIIPCGQGIESSEEKSLKQFLNPEESDSSNSLQFITYIDDDAEEDNPCRVKHQIKILRCEEVFSDSLDWAIMFEKVSCKEKYKEFKANDARKDQLLANVSHDLRTPINSIVNILNLVMELVEPNQKKIKKYINLSIDSASSLLFLVNDLLDMSQIQKGKLKNLNIERLLLIDVINPVMNLLKFSAKKKGLEITCNYFHNETKEVLVDRYRLQQILVNLIGNAVKFTDKGGFVKVEIYEEELVSEDSIEFTSPFRDRKRSRTISTHVPSSPLGSHFNLHRELTEKPGKHIFSTPTKQKTIPCLLIKVSDNGIGIKNSDIPNLFTAFGKFETDKNKSGIGLGLSISQSLAKMMAPGVKNAGISVSSEYEKGSSFWFPLKIAEDFNLPVAFSEMLENDVSILDKIQTHTKRKDSQGGMVQHNNKFNNILVVDDDQINLLVMRKLIQKSGNFRLDTAINGRDAVKIIESYKEKGQYFDIVIMDKNMPACDGLQAASEIHDLVQKKVIPSLPVYILTAADTLNLSNKMFPGVKEFLRKPLSLSDLKRLLGH